MCLEEAVRRENLTAVGSGGGACCHPPTVRLQPFGAVLAEAPGPDAAVPYANKASSPCTTQASTELLTGPSTPSAPGRLLPGRASSSPLIPDLITEKRSAHSKGSVASMGSPSVCFFLDPHPRLDLEIMPPYREFPVSNSLTVSEKTKQKGKKNS